jgi:DGQHR domain-containing protein
MKAQRPDPQLLVKSNQPEGSVASYPALPLEQNNQRFYIMTVPKEDVFPFCFVVDRQEDPIAGFQRSLDLSRAREISRYLDESRGSIPTNLVLSARAEADIRYNNRNKTLQFKRTPRAFLVLDGQHRLYGYGLTKKPHRVPVAIYEALSRKEEVALFIDINTTQRGVPAALLLDIKQLADREDEAEAALRELFDYLGAQADSPLFGLMSPSEAARGKISRPGFNRAVAPVLRLDVMAQLPREKRFELFKNYLRALDQTLQDPKLLRINVYLESFSAVFDDVLRLSRDKHGNFKLPSLTDVLAPLRNVNLAEVSSKGKARLTKNTIVGVLKQLLIGNIVVDPEMV